MAYVRLLVDYDGNSAGELVSLPATVARSLVFEKKAVEGKKIYEYGPFKEEAVSKNYEKRGKQLTPLPDDFPEKERLEKAGLDTIEKVSAASDKEITDIKYIGQKTLEDIRAY